MNQNHCILRLLEATLTDMYCMLSMVYVYVLACGLGLWNN